MKQFYLPLKVTVIFQQDMSSYTKIFDLFEKRKTYSIHTKH